MKSDLQRTVAAVPQLKRGMVWYLQCGSNLKVDSAACLRLGWPKCCGYTMTIDSPAERAAMAKSDVPQGLKPGAGERVDGRAEALPLQSATQIPFENDKQGFVGKWRIAKAVSR